MTALGPRQTEGTNELRRWANAWRDHTDSSRPPRPTFCVRRPFERRSTAASFDLYGTESLSRTTTGGSDDGQGSWARTAFWATTRTCSRFRTQELHGPPVRQAARAAAGICRDVRLEGAGCCSTRSREGTDGPGAGGARAHGGAGRSRACVLTTRTCRRFTAFGLVPLPSRNEPFSPIGDQGRPTCFANTASSRRRPFCDWSERESSCFMLWRGSGV
jgi:hypothetical protein